MATRAWSVLLVDDSPVMRRVVRRVLELSEFPCSGVLEAADGMEALEVLEHHAVDIMLTDINMPRLNGEELLSVVAKDNRFRSVAVVVVSTDGTAVRAKRMLALGARGYVTKPFTPEALAEELFKTVGAMEAA